MTRRRRPTVGTARRGAPATAAGEVVFASDGVVSTIGGDGGAALEAGAAAAGEARPPPVGFV